jgi:hypothetical protein
VCDSSGAVIAEVEFSGAPPGRTARLTLDLGYASVEAAAAARDLARGMLTQIEAMLADPATDLPPYLRDAVTGLADALAQQTGSQAPVTALDTPLTRAWRAHPAGRGR